MTSIHYIPFVFALVLTAAWLTSSKLSSTPKREEMAKPDTLSLTSRSSLAEEKQRSGPHHRNAKDKLAQSAKGVESAQTVDPASVFRDGVNLQKYRNQELGMILVRWMQMEPKAATEWLQSQADPIEWGGILAEAVKIDRSATMALVDALADDMTAKGLRAQCMFSIFSEIDDQNDFAAEMATLPAAWRDGAKLEYYSKFEHGEGKLAVADDLKSILDRNMNLCNSYQAVEAVRSHANQYVISGDYREGLDWAMSLPDFSRDTGVTQLAAEWIEKDPATAAGWINQLPQGPTRDQTTGYLISIIRDDNPSLAMQWAMTLSSREAGYAQARMIYDNWKRTNPVEAQKAIDSLNVGR